MSRRCELTGKGVMTGHHVSHSNIKTNRRYLPNLQTVTLQSEALGRSFRFRIAASTLRTVDHRGGLDAFLVDASEDGLSPRALKVKKDVAAATAGAAEATPRRPRPRELRRPGSGRAALTVPSLRGGFCVSEHIPFDNIRIILPGTVCHLLVSSKRGGSDDHADKHQS